MGFLNRRHPKKEAPSGEREGYEVVMLEERWVYGGASCGLTSEYSIRHGVDYEFDSAVFLLKKTAARNLYRHQT